MPVSPALDHQIQQTLKTAEKLQRLVSEDRPHVIKDERDPLCLIYWTLMFEHHFSILSLARIEMNSSAFALVRPFEEAFFLLVLAMHGTTNEFRSIRNGTLSMDFAHAGKTLDDVLAKGGAITAAGASMESWYKVRKDRLHSFTHGGMWQVVRHVDGHDIAPKFPEKEVREMVETTMLHVHLAACLVTLFLNLNTEHGIAVDEFKRYQEWIIARGSV